MTMAHPWQRNDDEVMQTASAMPTRRQRGDANGQCHNDTMPTTWDDSGNVQE